MLREVRSSWESDSINVFRILALGDSRCGVPSGADALEAPGGSTLTKLSDRVGPLE